MTLGLTIYNGNKYKNKNNHMNLEQWCVSSNIRIYKNTKDVKNYELFYATCIYTKNS